MNRNLIFWQITEPPFHIKTHPKNKKINILLEGVDTDETSTWFYLPYIFSLYWEKMRVYYILRYFDSVLRTYSDVTDFVIFYILLYFNDNEWTNFYAQNITASSLSTFWFCNKNWQKVMGSDNLYIKWVFSWLQFLGIEVCGLHLDRLWQ